MTSPGSSPVNAVAVVGGGPAGLYLAYLLKRRRPSLTVRVFERGPANATWGFGVVLADGGLRQLASADEVSFQAISSALHTLDRQTFLVNGEVAPIDKARPGGAIERLKLLQILHSACATVGVDLCFGTDVKGLGALHDFDLVVGADGSSSLVRELFAQDFGTKRRLLTNRFAWFGVERGFEGSFLNFKSIPEGGLCGHYYGYAPDRATFVMECDEKTWFGLGLDRMDDAQRRVVTQAYFADELDGCPLIENNSIWRQFPVVTNARWFTGRCVLIGDALRTAHFSIGSGTRMALEDSIALAEALLEEPDRDSALSAFVARRQAPMQKLAAAAEGSFSWYEDFSERLAGASAADFALSFLRRTGRISPERLLRDFPDFVAFARSRGLDVPGAAPAQSAET